MNEEWAHIPGYPGCMVSNLGRVQSANGRIKSTDSDRKGYLRVKLWRQGEPKNIKVHRLAYMAFNGQIPSGLVVRHENGINTDNRVINLCLGTYADNEADKVRHGTVPVGEKHHSRKLSEADVRAIRKRYVKGCSLNGAKAIAVDYGVSGRTIGHVVNGNTWIHM